MLTTDCFNCGEEIPTFAQACPHCGAPNRARTAGLAVVAALAALCVAAVVTVGLILHRPAPEVVQEAPGTAPEKPAPVADFGWLRTAMAGCDADAAKQPSTLHFLVIPLVVSKDQDAAYRSKSLNDIGNGTLVNSDTALGGLESAQLKLATQEYVFAIRDETSNVVYKWKPSTGVVRFSTPDSDAIASFKIQFQTKERSDDTVWGATFTRNKGNCYWVNAIIGN